MTRPLTPDSLRREQTQRIALLQREIRFMSERLHATRSVMPEDKTAWLDRLQD